MPSTGVRIASALTGALLLAGLASCTAIPRMGPPAAHSAPGSGAAEATAARTHMEALANGIGDRYPGTAAEQRAREYVRSALEQLGYTVETQPFTFGRRGDDRSANLIATKQGESSREIVVGAHYDSGDEGDGADDNASGVGVLLATAEGVREAPTPYTIRFVAFGAEEADDLYGSSHYVAQLNQAERQNIVAMVNLDSLSAGDIPYVHGDSDQLREWVRDAAAEAGQPMDSVSVNRLYGDTDYYPFQRAGIPFIYFEASNWKLGERDGSLQVDPSLGNDGVIMHTRYDTVRYLDDTFPGRIDQRLNLFTSVLVGALTEYRS